MDNTTLTLKRVVNASIKEVFEAFTNPEIISKWFFPADNMSVDVVSNLYQGGYYIFKIHNHDGKGGEFLIQGEYKKVQPYNKLVFTWNNELVEGSIVNLDFNDLKTGTEIVLTHDFLPPEIHENHTIGWNGCLNRLEAVISS